VEAGEYVVIVGPTGSGKTLLLETIAGFHVYQSGAVYIDGVDVTMWPPEKRNIGYMPQSQSLFPNMTVKDNIEFGLKMRKIGSFEQTKRSADIMELLDIRHLATRSPQSLSGGEKQKVALARALVLQPGILLLDEPMSSVDALAQRDVMDCLRTLHKSLGTTFVHVTHNHEEAGFLADKIGIMFDGRFSQVGATVDVYARPSSSEVARFLGFDNIFQGVTTSGAFIEIGDKRLVYSGEALDNASSCGWRRRSVKVSREMIVGENVLEGVVTDSKGIGASSQLTINVGFTVIAGRQDNYMVGDLVYIQIPSESIILW
jgi:molybdate/tungstate transport system ATP-binding protein